MKRKTHSCPVVALLVAALLVCAAMLAACDASTTPRYKVTVAEYDATLGSVTVSAPAEGKLYAEGERVTVTATPATDCFVSSFAVTHDDVSAVTYDVAGGGNYTFTVTADTTVTVVFSRSQFTQRMLDSLKGGLALEGTCSYFSKDADLEYTLRTEFTDGAYYNKEVLLNNGQTEVVEVFRSDENVPVSYYLTRENKLGEEVMMKDTDGDLLGDAPSVWEDFSNPFDLLELSDFAVGETAGEFVLSADKASRTANVITRYDDTIDEFYLIVENGVVTRLEFMYNDGGYYCNYDLDVVGRGDEVTAPAKPETKPLTAAHNKLSAALDELTTGNYTMTHRLEEENSVVEYKVYSADNAYFCDYESNDEFSNIDPFGYVMLGDGIYEFTYDADLGKAVKGDKAGFDDIKAANPRRNVNIALFESKGNGLFEAYDVYLPDDHGMLATVAAIALDNVSDRGNYATNLRIRLTEDMRHVASITYDFDVMMAWSGKVTLTFGNFGETDVPIDFDQMVDGEDRPPVALPGPTGTFTVSSVMGDIDVTVGSTIEITDTAIIINGQTITFTIESVGSSAHLVFYYNDIRFSADYWGAWYISGGEYTITITLSPQ